MADKKTKTVPNDSHKRYPLECKVCSYRTWSWHGWVFACYDKTEKDCEGHPGEEPRKLEGYRHPFERAKCSCGQEATHFNEVEEPKCKTCDPGGSNEPKRR